MTEIDEVVRNIREACASLKRDYGPDELSSPELEYRIHMNVGLHGLALLAQANETAARAVVEGLSDDEARAALVQAAIELSRAGWDPYDDERPPRG